MDLETRVKTFYEENESLFNIFLIMGKGFKEEGYSPSDAIDILKKIEGIKLKNLFDILYKEYNLDYGEILYILTSQCEAEFWDIIKLMDLGDKESRVNLIKLLYNVQSLSQRMIIRILREKFNWLIEDLVAHLAEATGSLYSDIIYGLFDSITDLTKEDIEEKSNNCFLDTDPSEILMILMEHIREKDKLDFKLKLIEFMRVFKPETE